MNITRKDFLKLGLMGGAGLALPIGAWQTARSRIRGAQAVVSPKVKPFAVPLPVPPALKPIRADATTDYYEITQKKGRAEILPGMETEVWGHNGIFPGPTIEARSGRRVIIRQTNELPTPVSVHLHGGVTPPESDGYPTDLILPTRDPSHPGHGHGAEAWTFSRGFKDYEYPNEQRAATLWYHDHRMDFTGPQNYRGLSGFYIIRDEVEDGLPLPQGEKEVPLMIADRIFKGEGSFYYPSIDPTLEGQPGVLGEYHKGVFGDTVLVNGAPWPTMEVSNTKYRFRILNASNARVYELALDPPPPHGKPFVQVGSDGGLLSAPISHERVRISPAERFDVVIDFSRYRVGTEVTLKNLFGKWSWTSRKEGQTSEVMRFRVAREEKDESAIPGRLAPDLDFPDPEEAEVRREFDVFGSALGMFTINEKVFDHYGLTFDPSPEELLESEMRRRWAAREAQ